MSAITQDINNASASATTVANDTATVVNSANQAGNAVCGPDYGGASGSWGKGWSAGTIGSATYDGGLVAGSSGTVSSGSGIFSHSGWGSFVSGGGISGSGNSNAWVIGGSVGGGGGVWYANTGNIADISGPFMTTSVNTPYLSVSFAESNGVHFYSIVFGPSLGGSTSHYVTNTNVVDSYK